jgi:protein dithiol oxidoreductase (disulfide-forming)
MTIQRRRLQQAALAGLIVPAAPRALAQGTAFRERTSPAPVEAPAPRIEVVDFFWYGCPHCNAFAPMLEPWVERLPADVTVRRAPVGFQPSFAPHQRLYFTLEAMGQVPAFHRRVFHAIHAERQRLNSEASILDWARSQSGLDAGRFAQLYASFGVANKVTRASQLQEAYGVTGVPALGVAGRYYTDGGLAGDMARALAEVDRLIDVVRRSRRG